MDCYFNFDFITNELRDFFVDASYLSSSFTWFFITSSLLYKRGWLLKMGLDSLNARSCPLESISTFLDEMRSSSNFSLVHYFFLLSWFGLFFYVKRQCSVLSVLAISFKKYCEGMVRHIIK